MTRIGDFQRFNDLMMIVTSYRSSSRQNGQLRCGNISAGTDTNLQNEGKDLTGLTGHGHWFASNTMANIVFGIVFIAGPTNAHLFGGTLQGIILGSGLSQSQKTQADQN